MRLHHSYLEIALAEAQTMRGFCAPNPAVGAVIVDELGQVVARGHHHGPGTPHAEIDALRQLSATRKGMTLYVTLEPCCHYGRTPPCTEAIIHSGIKHVIYAYQDPNPIVAGKGAEKLKAAGISCEYLPSSAIDAFYQSYHFWHTHHVPRVTTKLAMTMNGKIAGVNGERVQITGLELQELTHQQRKQTDAILTTAKTIHADNPLLNVRLNNEIFAKPIYILDGSLSLSTDANIFSTAKSVTLLHSAEADLSKREMFASAGVRCVAIASHGNKLELTEVMRQIGQDGVHDLWVEAGGVLTGQLIQESLVQRCLFYVAPTWLERGLDALTFDIESKLSNVQFSWHKFGEDLLADIIFSSR